MLITPDFRKLFERGFAVLEEASDTSWHDADFDIDGTPYIHASSVLDCPRKYVLAAIGEANDGNTVDSSMNFAFGKTLHKALEDTFNIIPDFDGWKMLFAEIGGTHSYMPLKGKPDAILLAPSGQVVAFDLKSEAATGKVMRERDAKKDGRESNVRPEHMVQITAGAILAEDHKLVSERIDVGMALYVSRQTGKNVWDIKPELFEITDELRAEVVRGVKLKVKAWRDYKTTGVLPPRLAKEWRFGKMVEPWQCRPRGEEDCRGLYCPARVSCFEKHQNE